MFFSAPLIECDPVSMKNLKWRGALYLSKKNSAALSEGNLSLFLLFGDFGAVGWLSFGNHLYCFGWLRFYWHARTPMNNSVLHISLPIAIRGTSFFWFGVSDFKIWVFLAAPRGIGVHVPALFWLKFVAIRLHFFILHWQIVVHLHWFRVWAQVYVRWIWHFKGIWQTWNSLNVGWSLHFHGARRNFAMRAPYFWRPTNKRSSETVI